MAICGNCCLDLLEVLETLNIDLNELSTALEEVTLKDNGKLTCGKCKQTLSTGDLYFNSEEDFEYFVEEATVAIGKSLSEKIEFCSHCEGSEIEFAIARFNKELEEDEVELPQRGVELQEFLFDVGIPDQYFDQVAENLVCQNCGYGEEPYHPKHNPDGGHFDVWDRIYSQEDINEFYGVDVDEFIKLGTLYGIEFYKQELTDFQDIIYNYPLLAYKHPIGQKIYTVLQNHFDKGGYTTLSQGATVYRGRNRKRDSNTLKPDQLWNPPVGVASHGRYNSIGISVLYCTDSIEAIPNEIHPQHDDEIDIATFQIKSSYKLLDVSKLFNGFEGFLSVQNAESKTLKSAYLLTNYIRDCCADIGYNGIRYKGVPGAGEYNNYAFFNFAKGQDIDIVGTRTFSFDIKYRIHDGTEIF